MNDPQKPVFIEERKKQLIAQGALFRAHIIESREIIQANLHPGVIVKDAIGQVFRNMVPFKGEGETSIDFQRFLPLLFSIGSFLSKRSLPKLTLRKSLIIGAIGALGTLSVFISQNKKKRDSASNF